MQELMQALQPLSEHKFRLAIDFEVAYRNGARAMAALEPDSQPATTPEPATLSEPEPAVSAEPEPETSVPEPEQKQSLTAQQLSNAETLE